MCNKNISKSSGTQTLNEAQSWGRDDSGDSFSLRSELKHGLALKGVDCTLKNARYSNGGGAHLLIPAPRRQRQKDLCESESSLVYRVTSRC